MRRRRGGGGNGGDNDHDLLLSAMHNGHLRKHVSSSKLCSGRRRSPVKAGRKEGVNNYPRDYGQSLTSSC